MKKLLLVVTFIACVNFTNAQWQQTSLDSASIRSFAVSGNNIFAGSEYSGLYRYSSNGGSWMNTGFANTEVLALTVKDTNIFAGTSDLGVFLSSNNGNSWDSINTGLPYNGFPATHTVLSFTIKDSIICAGTNDGVFLSSNNGSSWISTNSTMHPDAHIGSLAVSGSNIFAGSGCSDPCVYISSNNGNTWTEIDNGMPPNSEIFSLAIHDTVIYAGVGCGNYGAYSSIDNGSIWIAKKTGLPIDGVTSLITYDSIIIGGTSSHGVYLSMNNGNNWSAINTGLTNYGLYVWALAIFNDTLYAGTKYAGVWKRPLCDILKPSSAGVITGDISVCQGQKSVIYYVPIIANATSYVWTIPVGTTGTSNTNIISVNFDSSSVSGTIAVNGINNCGEGPKSALAVNVHPKFLINNPQDICQGNSYSLNGHSYTNAGTYYDTLSTIYGCDSVIVTTLQVNSLPVLFAGINQTVCSGNPVILNATGGTNLNWNNGVMNGVPFIPDSTNIYIVSVIDVNNCTTSDTVLVTVNPLPNVHIIKDTTICNGVKDTLFTSGGVSYLWSYNNLTSQNIIVSPTTTTTYTVTVTDNNGCTASDSAIITVDTLNLISISLISGGTVLSCDQQLPHFQWYFNSNLIPGAISQVFTPFVNGFYTLMGTDSFGCSVTSSPFNYVYVDVNNFDNNNSFSVFPIPSNDIITVVISVNSTIEFLNIQGQIIKRLIIKDHKTNIDISDFSSGVYIIRAQTDDGIITKKFIKE